MNLVKIGNIKIGEKRKGKPIVREGLLVTQAVKDNEEEFFLPFPGFTRSGEEMLDIVLPFDNPELNFETGYVSFGNVKFFSDEFLSLKRKNPEEAEKIPEEEKYEKIVPYMFKEIDDKNSCIIVGIPLSEYAPDVQAPFLYFGKCTDEWRKELHMEYTGILKCMINNVSGWGEVFHFKTKSKATINAIKNQLFMIDKITKGQTAGLILRMRAFRKQYNNKIFPFVDISIPATNAIEMKEIISNHLEARTNFFIDIKTFEREYMDRLPSLVEFYKGYKTKFEIEFEENEDVIHELYDKEEENKKIKENEIEQMVEQIAEKFKITNTPQKTALKTLIERVANFFNTKEEQLEEINKRLEEIKSTEGNISGKSILSLVKDYTKE